MNAHDDIRILLPSAALGELGPDEQDAVDRHLASCPICSEELAALQETTAAMMEGLDPVEPTSGHREATLAAMTASRRRSSRDTVSVVSTSSGLLSRLLGRVVQPVAVPALAATTILFALTTATLWMEAADRSETISSLESRLAAAGNGQDTDEPEYLMSRSETFDTSGPLKRATVYVANRQGNARATALVLHDLPAPDDGQTWQLWTIDADGVPASAGLIPDGGKLVIIPVDASVLTQSSGMALTLEPAGGSDAPTTTPSAYAAV